MYHSPLQIIYVNNYIFESVLVAPSSLREAASGLWSGRLDETPWFRLPGENAFPAPETSIIAQGL